MVRHGQATAAELISQEPESELRVIGMGIEDGVGGMRVGPFPLADRFGQPLVVGLTGEPEDPARRVSRESRRGPGPSRRDRSFWGLTQFQVRLGQIRGRTP